MIYSVFWMNAATVLHTMLAKCLHGLATKLNNRQVHKMIYISRNDDSSTIAQVFKSLQEFSKNYCEPSLEPELRDNGSSSAVHYLRVYKTKKAWRERLGYTIYAWRGDKLIKSKLQQSNT